MSSLSRARRRWSLEETHHLARRYDDPNTTIRAIAKEMNRTIHSVSCKAHELRLLRTDTYNNALAKYLLREKDENHY